MRGATKNTKNIILSRWAEILARRPSDPAILARDATVERTFADIQRESQAWVEKLRSHPPGAVIAIQAGNSPSWPALLLASMRLGLIPLPLGRHMAPDERHLALATCRASLLVTEPEGPDRTLALQALPAPSLLEAGCDFLKLTSGTTALPRAIRFTAAQLLADCDNICDTMGISGTDLNFGVIPFSHSYGFSNLITPLLCRGVPLVASEDRMPRAILNDLARTRATVFPGMPVFFEKLAALDDSPPLPHLRLCISAGAPLPASAGASFSARFSLKIHTFYGSSECGGIAYDSSDALTYQDAFVGHPMRNVQITPLSDDQENPSQIAVRSHAVGETYFPDSDPDTLGAGQFIPADLVRIDSHGIHLTGRATDIINIAGRKLNPAEVEARLAQHPGIRQVVVFGIASSLRNEEAIACVTGSADPDTILRYARTILSPWQVPKAIWHLDEIPTNDRGKISRKSLAATYLKIPK